MKFGDKLKELRAKKDLNQEDLAKAVGVSTRTIAGYESDGRYPRKRELYSKLADALGCSADYLLTEQEEFIAKAGDIYGSTGKKQAEEAVNVLSGMFAGGELSDDDRDAVFKALTDAYWDAKQDNKKYTPFRFRKDKD